MSRADSTIVDAYLTPVVRDYVRRIGDALPEARLRLMTSAGGLAEAAGYSGRDAVVSGASVSGLAAAS